MVKMVNGLHLYSAFFATRPPKALNNIASQSPIHTHIHGGVSHARHQSAGREQLGLGALLRHLDTARRSQGSNQQPCGYQPTRIT